jgi:hypothetical protein
MTTLCDCTDCVAWRSENCTPSTTSEIDAFELNDRFAGYVRPCNARTPFASMENYTFALKRRGFRYLAGGLYGQVWHTPGSPYVVKVGRSSDDAWPAYAAFCIENPGPFRPVVRSLKWHFTGNGRAFYVAVIERLSCTLNEACCSSEAHHNHDYLRVIRQVVDMGKDLVPQAKRFRARGMVALADFLDQLSKAFPCACDDAHHNNWMFRADGALILTDPFSSGSSSSRERRRGSRELQLALPF